MANGTADKPVPGKRGTSGVAIWREYWAYNDGIQSEDTMNEHEKPERSPFAVGIPAEVRQHFRAARREVRAGIRSLLPPEFLQHGRAARREMLLAWRQMIDAALEHWDDDRESIE